MAAVDIDAIEAQMKMAALDTLKGYSPDHYGTVQQYRETDYVSERNAGGYQVLREPSWNKGTVPLSIDWLACSALKHRTRETNGFFFWSGRYIIQS